MKKSLFIVGMIILLTHPLISSASYLVRLQNSSELVTSQYWENGNQIEFYLYGGIVGIKKDFIKSIEESNQVYQGRKRSTEKPDPGSPQTETETETGSAPKEDHNGDEINRLKEQSKKIWDNYNKLLEKGSSRAERDKVRKKAFEIDARLKELTTEQGTPITN